MLIRMQKVLAPILTVIVLFFSACGDEAQQAAEEANKDTVPVIETNKDKDKPAAAAGSGGSATIDSTNAR